MRGRMLVVIGMLWLGACHSSPTSAEDNVYTGTLQSGIMAIGGEHTGWMLEPAGQADKIEVDVERVAQQAKELRGQSVRITGRVRLKEYVERGPTPILVAETIEPATKS